MTPWRGLGTAVVLVALVASAGCAGTPQPDPTLDAAEYPSFDRPQETSDMLDADQLPDEIDPASVRYGGQFAETTFYLGRTLESGTTCVLIDDPRDETDGFASGCGGDVTFNLTGVASASVLAASAPTPEGWTRIGDNLAVQVP